MLMWSFAANEVHTVKPGHCRTDTDGVPVTDTITEGMRQLIHGANSLIAKFNRTFAQLQKRHKLMPVSTQWEHLEASFAWDGMGNRSESGAPADTNNNKSENKSENKDERMSENETNCSDSESGTEGQDEQSGSESGADSSKSEESEGEEYWEEAFNFEFEFGEEALNVFGDMNLSDEEEAFEYDELDNDNNGFIE
ncbi:hypothetical protein FRC11_006139, partial [Ceratobasidium sp. 423]